MPFTNLLQATSKPKKNYFEVTYLDSYSSENRSCFVFRDDLLGGIASGSKHRKYSGLFDFLVKNPPSIILIPASLGTNHLLLSCQYARAFNLPFKVITKPLYSSPNLNARLTLELLQDGELIYANDPNQEAFSLHELDKTSFIMPPGGFHRESAISAKSLGYELIEPIKGFKIEHLFLDAGTGLQAASCIAALIEGDFKGTVYVVKMGPLDFDQVLKTVKEWLNFEEPKFKIRIFEPYIAKSFGSRNAKIKSFAKEFYQKTGIILDPIYSAKLFYTALEFQKLNELNGNMMIVHSGGTLSALDEYF